MTRLQGRVAFVTGAGIGAAIALRRAADGAAIALRLAADGAAIAVVDR